MTDQELIDGLKNNRQAAFRHLVEQYQTLVVSTCFHFLHDIEDAHDLAQEVFIEVFQSIHKFRQESSLSTWLYRISVNKSLNYIRKNRYRSLWVSFENALLGNQLKSKVEDPAKALEEEHEYESRVNQLNQAIDQLPDNQRKAFILHKYNNLSYKDIAEVMDVSLSSVESLMHRAKTNLQTKLINRNKRR